MQLRELIREYALAGGVSGTESPIRRLIMERVAPHADAVETDGIGNLYVKKRGRARAARRVMLTAHMDEVGLIISYIREDGFLRFMPVGGLDYRVLLGRRVFIGKNNVPGVIGILHRHQTREADRDKIPPQESFYIDIGARDREDAQASVSPGDAAVFDSEYAEFGDGFIKCKALDNRVGCALLTQMIIEGPPCDADFVFTTQEEIGLRGALVAARRLEPQYAVVVDTTTAADFVGVRDDLKSTRLGEGGVVYLAESGTYFAPSALSALCKEADRAGVKWQYKTLVAGGVEAGALQTFGEGIEVVAVATPCRYLHSPSCVIKYEDALQAKGLILAALRRVY